MHFNSNQCKVKSSKRQEQQCRSLSAKIDATLNRAARPISSRLKSLCFGLNCTGQCTGTNNKDLSWSGLDRAFRGSSKA